MAGLIRRGNTFYALYYVAGQQRRTSLKTTSLQVAKEKLRQIESALCRDEALPMPTRTPLATVLAAYVEQIKTVKTHKSAQNDFYYLRQVFGPAMNDIQFGVKKIITKSRKKGDRFIEAKYLEQITTAEIAGFIADGVRQRGWAAKTANRYREILTRLFNWSTSQYGVKLPGDKNPAAKVERYKESAPKINFLTLGQIDELLESLKADNQLQTMVAVYIYAGLRRSEALWLTVDDVDLDTGSYGMLRIRAKEIDGEFWEPKTKTNRVVPISSKLRGYLDRCHRPETDEPWLFLSPKGRMWDADNFSQKLAEKNRSEMLSGTCLDFRHTFGSQLAMKGESLYKISTLMGNSPEICRRHYAALIPEEMQDVVEF